MRGLRCGDRDPTPRGQGPDAAGSPDGPCAVHYGVVLLRGRQPGGFTTKSHPTLTVPPGQGPWGRLWAAPHLRRRFPQCRRKSSGGREKGCRGPSGEGLGAPGTAEGGGWCASSTGCKVLAAAGVDTGQTPRSALPRRHVVDLLANYVRKAFLLSHFSDGESRAGRAYIPCPKSRNLRPAQAGFGLRPDACLSSTRGLSRRPRLRRVRRL